MSMGDENQPPPQLSTAEAIATYCRAIALGVTDDAENLTNRPVIG